MIDIKSKAKGQDVCCCCGDLCVVVMVTGGILGRWGGRMQRDSCWGMATRGELFSSERVRPPKVKRPHTLTLSLSLSLNIDLLLQLQRLSFSSPLISHTTSYSVPLCPHLPSISLQVLTLFLSVTGTTTRENTLSITRSANWTTVATTSPQDHSLTPSSSWWSTTQVTHINTFPSGPLSFSCF